MKDSIKITVFFSCGDSKTIIADIMFAGSLVNHLFENFSVSSLGIELL